jgi:hypothetical protein
MAKRRIFARLGSSATAGERTQNLLCAYLAIAVFAGLAANTFFGAWWLDGTSHSESPAGPSSRDGERGQAVAATARLPVAAALPTDVRQR